MTSKLLIFGLALLLFFPLQSWSYPEFIGYKYSSCLTCHYNGQGNGPINDYGRAIWSAEIAGKLFNEKKTDEELANASGFLGSKQLPWWIRPGIKSRYLELQTNPGGANSASRGILMQADANVALFFDRDQKYIFVGSLGYVPEPNRLSSSGEKVDTIISREHYFRYQKSESMWFYVGMLDKVYGIRQVNHSAYSRAKIGIAQNDQTHGVVGHYIRPEWEWTVHGFVGNLYQDSNLRQVGASTLYEYEIKPAWRIGTSALFSSNEFVGNQRFAIHSKYGFGNGAALLFELGNIKDTPKNGTGKSGYYLFSEAIQKVVRGYHAFMTGQAYKSEFSAKQQDELKFGAGVLAFPMARTELRLEVENRRKINGGGQVPGDTWALLMQMHLSL